MFPVRVRVLFLLQLLFVCGGRKAAVSAKESTTVYNCCKKDDPKCSNYKGTKYITSSGKKCQAWNQQSPHDHKQTKSKFDAGDFETNYCRNPDGEPGGAWCYTMDGDTRWEYCGIPTCQAQDENDKQYHKGGRCGKSFPINGRPAQCNPWGEFPCCSEPQGWCGKTWNHCHCSGCIDYTSNIKKALPKIQDIYPGELSSKIFVFEVLGEVFVFVKEVKTWDEARQICKSMKGDLASLPSSEMSDDVLAQIRAQDYKAIPEANLFSANDVVWLGATHSAISHYNGWAWVSGDYLSGHDERWRGKDGGADKSATLVLEGIGTKPGYFGDLPHNWAIPFLCQI